MHTEYNNETSYDQIPYPSYSYLLSHPDRMATIARLLGVAPPDINHAKVLELGCASGGNLIPMAYCFPNSTFTGIDYAKIQIEEGLSDIKALGLSNIKLQHLDIIDIEASFGSFDFIIAHGIYSWVPEHTQNKLFSIFKENLAPGGIAYVCYNTYPGWHMMNIARDMMLFHTRNLTDDPIMRAREGRNWINFMAEVLPDDDSAYSVFLKMYARFINGEIDGGRPENDSLLLHDELEKNNHPIYFHQFHQQISQNNLQYLGDSDFPSMVNSNLPQKVTSAVNELVKSEVELEQYMDFLQNRTIRHTLICHQGIKPNRSIKPEILKQLFISSNNQTKEKDISFIEKTKVNFIGTDGAVLATDHPLTKVAMSYLSEIWPRSVSFEKLIKESLARLENLTDQNKNTLSENDTNPAYLALNILRTYCYSSMLIELRSHQPDFASQIEEKPVASPVARLQSQKQHFTVTNMRHERIRLDKINSHIMQYLDGKHNLQDITEALIQGPIAKGELEIKQNDTIIVNQTELKNTIENILQANLDALSRSALLIKTDILE